MSKGAGTRERILDTAFRMAARDGLEGLSLGELASELGLSKSGLFAHFKSKEQLQLDVLATGRERFIQVVMLPAMKQARGLPRLRAMMENWLRWARDASGGCLFQAAATELDDREGPARDFVAESQREMLATLAKATRLAIQEGHFRKDLEPEQFAFELHGFLLAYHQHQRLLRDPNCERRVRAAFDRLVRSASADN
jgi:AcrR family transcriptional regulator